MFLQRSNYQFIKDGNKLVFSIAYKLVYYQVLSQHTFILVLSIQVLYKNCLFQASSLTAIIIGVLAHLFLFFSASFLLSYGFSYSQYSPYLYIYGIILLPISCIGIAVTFRHSYRLTKFVR